MCFQGGRGVKPTFLRPSHVERVLASSLPFSGVVELAHLYASCSFIELFPVPKTGEYVPSVLSLPAVVCNVGSGGSLCYRVSVFFRILFAILSFVVQKPFSEPSFLL